MKDEKVNKSGLHNFKKYAEGGIVKTGKVVPAEERIVVLTGSILTCQSTFHKFGAEAIQKLNKQSDAEIVIIPDSHYESMTASEKIQFLQQNTFGTPNVKNFIFTGGRKCTTK